MIRNTMLGAGFVAIALLFGCDKSPAEARNDAREAQRRAEEIAQQAQAKADEARQRAEQTFVKTRNDLRAQLVRNLNDVSADIDSLRLRASKATGRTKVELDAAVKSLDEQRLAFIHDLDTLDRTTAQDFDALKARLNAALEAMKKSVNDASSRI